MRFALDLVWLRPRLGTPRGSKEPNAELVADELLGLEGAVGSGNGIGHPWGLRMSARSLALVLVGLATLAQQPLPLNRRLFLSALPTPSS